MGQVAFDTHEFIETLENAGLPVEQAKAISLAVRKSHEAVDVATKYDIAEVKRDLDDMHKDINVRFEKTDAQIAEVRKDLSAEIGNVRKDLSAEIDNVRKDMAAQSEKTNAQIADVRKDMDVKFEKTDAKIDLLRKDIDVKFDKLGLQLTIKLGVMIAAAVGIVAAVLRMPL